MREGRGRSAEGKAERLRAGSGGDPNRLHPAYAGRPDVRATGSVPSPSTRVPQASLGEVVSEKEGGESEGETGGKVEGEDGSVSGAEERGVLIHEAGKGRESAAESGGKEKAQARVETSGTSGEPRHEAEQEASRHVHGEGRPRESRSAACREHEKPGRTAHEAAAADEKNGKEGFHNGVGSRKRMPFPLATRTPSQKAI